MATEVHEAKPVIKIKDISEELEQEIISIAKYALEKMHTNQ